MDTSRQAQPALTGYVITRLLISAYFIAFSLGLIGGTDVSILLRGILPPSAAGIVASSTICLAAVALVMGWYRTVAIFAISAILFFSSYLALNEMPSLALGQFWRDLALISILMLTHADTEARGSDIAALRSALPKEKSSQTAPQPKTSTRVLSRGSVQKAYTVNKSGRAMSRKVRESEAHAFSEELEAAAKLR